jgi:subtilase family serine protease
MLLIFLLAVASASVQLEGVYTNGWIKSPLPATGCNVTFTIALKEQGVQDVQRIALDVNNPASVNYGKFIQQDALDALTKPRSADVSAVTGWLKGHGVEFSVRGVSNIEVTTSVENGSKMLKTSFHKISNVKHGQAVIRAADYMIPDHVKHATAAFFGLHGLPLPPASPVSIVTPADDDDDDDDSQPHKPANVTPAVLASTYNIKGVKGSGSLQNRQAVAEFQGQCEHKRHAHTARFC